MRKLIRDGHLICCVLLFVVTLICFFPGFMTNDSFIQYQQALSRQYTDLYPPVMSFIWSLLWPSHLHQLGMLVFQLVLFWIGLALLVRALFLKTSWRILATILFLFVPAVFTQLGTIWKDIIVSASLLVAVALLIRRRALWVVIPLLFLGLSARYNALPAVLPLCIWWAAIRSGDIGRPVCRKVGTYLMGFGVCFGLFICSSLMTRLLIQGRSEYPAQVVQIFDLTGISVQEDRQVMPDYLKTILPLERLKSKYSPKDEGTIIYPNPSPLTHDREQARELSHYWLKQVFENIPVYLKHREAVFKDLVSWNTPENHYSFQAGIEPNTLGFHFKGNIFYKFLYRYFFRWKNTWVFRGWIYMVLCLLGAVTGFFAPRYRFELFWLGTSGFLYAVAYFICCPSSEFRYLYWTVMAAMVSILIAISAWVTPQEALRRSPQ